MPTPQTIGSQEIGAAIGRLADAIGARHRGATGLVLLGIANGGVELNRRVAAALAAHFPPDALHVGTLDISFHRDDIGSNPIPKEFAPTQIPIDIDGATVILVDDVLFSGRTVKAALDELFDHGRPAKVELAVLVDRGGRRLPIAADYIGLTREVAADEQVVVSLDSSGAADAITTRPPFAQR